MLRLGLQSGEKIDWREYGAEDTITLGRSPDNIIHVDDRKSSRNHCVILKEGQSWRLEDLRSANGTFVNGARITSQFLRNGDEIRIGLVRIHVGLPRSAEPPPPEAKKPLDEQAKAPSGAAKGLIIGGVVVLGAIGAVIAAILLLKEPPEAPAELQRQAYVEVLAVADKAGYELGRLEEAREQLEAFAEKYPDSTRSEEARQRARELDELRKSILRAEKILNEVEGELQAGGEGALTEDRIARALEHRRRMQGYVGDLGSLAEVFEGAELGQRARDLLVEVSEDAQAFVKVYFEYTRKQAAAAFEEEDYARALREWKAFIHRVQQEGLGADWETKARKLMGEVATEGRRAARELIQRARLLDTEGENRAAVALLQEQAARFEGIDSYYDICAAVSGLVQRGLGSEVTRLKRKREAARQLFYRNAAEAGALMRAFEFDKARALYEQVLEKLQDPDLRVLRAEFESRVQEVRAQARIFRSLIDAINKGKFRDVRVSLGGGLKGSYAKADETAVTLAFSYGTTRRRWTELRSRQLLELYLRLGLPREDLYHLAVFCYEQGVAAGHGQELAEQGDRFLHEFVTAFPDRKAQAFALLARVRGEVLPEEGYAYTGGRWISEAGEVVVRKPPRIEETPPEETPPEEKPPVEVVESDLEKLKARFLELAAQYDDVSDEERESIVKELSGVLRRTAELAQASLGDCGELCEFYHKRRRVLEANAELKALLVEHYAIYYDLAYNAADGPMAFSRLYQWVKKYRYDKGAEKLTPILGKLKPLRGGRYAKRASERKERDKVREDVMTFERKRTEEVVGQLEELVTWMRENEYAAKASVGRLRELIRRAVELEGEPAGAKRLLSDIDALTHAELEGKDEREKKFDERYARLVKRSVDRTIKVVDACLRFKFYGHAFDLFRYILQVDPDNKRAHKWLEHRMVDGKWVRAFEAKQLGKGKVWDSRLGWIYLKYQDRYADGSYYDFDRKRWTTVEEANQYHSHPDNAWRIESEHFEVVSTNDLQETVEAIERLEAFFLQAFRQYDLFFESKGGVKLIFGISTTRPPLTVNLYRSYQQFREYAKPPTEWAGGFYSPGQHASFFPFSRGSYGTLQHEITHQILGEYSSGGGGPSWLVEGAAVYLEDAFFRHGTLRLGELQDHRRVATYRRNLRNGAEEHGFKKMLTFRSGQEWDSGDIGMNYRGAGAIVYFMMHFDGGRYRADFVEMLRDSYSGSRRSPSDYFGYSEDALDFLQEHFYKRRG